MYQWVEGKAIDAVKWNECIAVCDWGNVYASYEHLNAVCGTLWKALIYKDYEAVMPVPYRKKFGVFYVYRPNFCQQLGVFIKPQVRQISELIPEFIRILLKSFKQVEYPLNHSNLAYIENQGGKIRTNFILPLNKSVETLFEQFSGKLKRSLNKTSRELIICEESNSSSVIESYKNAWNKLHYIPDIEYKRFGAYIDTLTKTGKAQNLVLQLDGQLLAACTLLFYKNRIYYPFSSITKEGRSLNATAVLIYHIIRKYGNSEKILDFEGSDIESVKHFYKKFNPINESYFMMVKRHPLGAIYGNLKRYIIR